MGVDEERRQKRNRVDLDSAASIEIHHTFGPVEKSVYEDLEHHEHGLSFSMPESDGYFRPGAPLKYRLMNSGESRVGNFGLVKYYQLFHGEKGRRCFKVGLESEPEEKDEQPGLIVRPELPGTEAQDGSHSILFTSGGRNYSLPLEYICNYSAAFSCTEEMALNFGMSRVLEVVAISSDGSKAYEGTVTVVRRSYDEEQGRYRIFIVPRKAAFHVDAN